MTKTTLTGQTIQTTKSETIEQIPLGDITADRNWNVRKYLGDDADGIGEHEFSDLVGSILAKGQDTPIVVRPTGTEGGAENSGSNHYWLVAGFRRYAAFTMIYSEGKTVPGIEPGCIKAVVRTLSDIEARAFNGRENIGRNNLNMADKAHLIGELKKAGLTHAQVGSELALSSVYVANLYAIYKGASELKYAYKDGRETTVFDHWREAPGRVSYENMLALSRIAVDPRIKELKYLELLNAKETEETKRNKGKIERPKNDGYLAERLGIMLGRLEAKGLISINEHNWREILSLSGRVALTQNTSEEYAEQICQAAAKGYARGLDR